MFKYRGGETVNGGYFWCRSTWRLEVVEGGSGVLPGGAGDAYVKVPVLVMIPLALLLSVPFVLFLPLVGFYVLGESVVSHARKALRGRSEPLTPPETRIS
jgi:hypothetical protein